MSRILFEYKPIGAFISKEELSTKDRTSDKSLANFLSKYIRVSKEDKQNNGIPKNVKGAVWLVKDKNASKSYLMKIIEKESKYKANGFGTYKEQIAIQRRITHPNFVSIVDYFEDLSNIYIVTESITLGNLSSVIVSKKQFDEREACLCFVQMCLILNFMHNNGLVHRDIRPETILVAKDFTLKLANLSCCTELEESTGKLYSLS